MLHVSALLQAIYGIIFCLFPQNWYPCTDRDADLTWKVIKRSTGRLSTEGCCSYVRQEPMMESISSFFFALTALHTVVHNPVDIGKCSSTFKRWWEGAIWVEVRQKPRGIPQWLTRAYLHQCHIYTFTCRCWHSRMNVAEMQYKGRVQCIFLLFL